jgi:hypothetical protein
MRMVRRPKDVRQGPRVDKQVLHQADLSHLRLQDMTPSERAELKRRYEHFVRHFRGASASVRSATAKSRRIRKWTPGRSGQAS